MKKNYKIFLLIAVCFFGCMYSRAQQKSEFQLDAVLSNLNNIFTKEHRFNEKISSSALFQEYNSGKMAEVFHIYSSTTKGDEAFLIVSNDSVSPTVLAYSDEHSFDVNNIPPAVKYWLETYAASSYNPSDENHLASSSVRASYREGGVAPLLGKTVWGQSKPFNNACPLYRGESTLAGCVATAMAQVMKYHSYPTQARGYTSYRTSTNKITVTHDFSKDVFAWDNMLDSYNSGYSNIQGTAVAGLMASCGAAVKMDYGTSAQGGSGAYQSDLIIGYIDNYGYDKDAAIVIRNYCSTDDWHRLLVEELNAGRPVNYAGSSMRDGGHSFVLDGYRISDSQYPYYHVNWGWSGSCDGYYQIANLQPVEDGNYATLSAFSQSQQMTIGVMPDDGNDREDFVFTSTKINGNLSKVKENGAISFHVSSLYNCSYKIYKGYISVALKNADNQLFVLDKGTLFQLNYLEGTGNLEFNCNVPSTVSKGTYEACLVYQLPGNSEWRQILSSSYPVVEVTENEEETHTREIWSELGCSEIELLQEDDRSKLSANIYELINLQVEPFLGYLDFTIADENGFPLFSFGDKIYIPELGFNDFITDNVRVSGTINQNLPDGYYRLYLSSHKQNQTVGSFVVYNDIGISGGPTKELFYRVSVKNSILYIEDKEYEIPSDVRNTLEQKQTNYLYSIGGVRMQDNTPRGKGLYIDRNNGRIRKIAITR